ncbi:Low-density lipoprotein receptor repeat class B [Dictyocaulus viviparus]|uniref:Low-density lipoprotein receptor repeat class B n=1 Tax=Dictyocaulus viviparus TaxID=29172 RepID=A0A0D8XND2_DICVI|nr:Low-density lipoprotein receptor repeat class B [Dictyocaulus viviparus]
MLIVFILLIQSSILNVTAVQCDFIEEVLSLHCVSSLVEYANADRHVLHPPLSDVYRACLRFKEYKQCTIGIHPDCRKSLALNIERLYENMCEENFLSLIREELVCLSQIERDTQLKECFLNRTNTLREENVGDYSISNISSYDCMFIQTYVDCLLVNKYETCNEAVKLEVSMLSMLANRHSDNCILKLNTLTTVRPDDEEPMEQCDKFGNCRCRQNGYYYDFKLKKCMDVDECNSFEASCSQKCVNHPGSFKCTCDPTFYHLDHNERTCIRNDKDPIWLLFAHGQSIWNISLNSGSFGLQKAGLQKTAVLDVDVLDRYIYYVDIGSNSIERLSLDESIPEIIEKYEVDGVEGIAVDWIGRNLYSLRRSNIIVQTLDGRYKRILYENVMRLPRAIALHPSKGMMFVSDWSSTPFIAKAAMDGSSFTKIIVDKISWPNALTVDIYADKIYWADAYNDVIEVAELDGMGRRKIISDSNTVPHIFALTVVDDLLYWTDWTYRGLLKADKLTGDNVTVVAQTALLPYGLKVFHVALQPQFSISCSSLGCEQLCLLGPEETAKCSCGEGYKLNSDGRRYGMGRRKIISDSSTVPHIFALTVVDDLLYWTDWTYRGLLKADKLTGDNVTVVAQTALLPYGLKVFHVALQPQFSISCSSLGCEQLCLLGPEETAKCSCGEGYKLNSDGRRCTSCCDSEHVECERTEAE